MTINGILTDETGAETNAIALQSILPKIYNNEKVIIDFLSNPSHLGGFGDILKSVYQGLFDSEIINDYDLVEMLKAASEKVRTQKILLVAHSQGNFYANSFYDTVAGRDGGVPPESIGVYSVATPSGRVAGDGKWLTSDTDKVIASIVGRALARPIMAPNTHIALQKDDDPLGHNFSTIYLKYRGAEIIADVKASLNRLETNDIQDSQKPCLDPPRLTLGHKIVGAVFAIADPIATAGNSTIIALATNIYNAGHAAIAGAANIFYGSSAALNDVTDASPATPATPTLIATKTATPPTPAPKIITEEINAASSPFVGGGGALPADKKDSNSSHHPEPAQKSSNTSSLLPFAGSGGPSQSQIAAAASASAAPSPSPSSASPSTTAVPDTTPPDPPVITTPSSNDQTATSTTITFLGTAEASSTISNSFSAATSTADNVGNWTLPITGLPQGTSSIHFFATDAAGNTSGTSSRTVFIDSQAPALSLSALGCSASLSANQCLIATTTFTVLWASSSSDLNYYTINCETDNTPCANFSSGTTTATSSTYSAPSDNAVYTFQVSATDLNENTSANQSLNIRVATRPVVINEIAWAGTSATKSNDEWLELYNPTDADIDLSDWVLRSTNDNTPYIKLSGVIAAKSFFLLERTDDSTVSDILANQIYTGALNNGGEVLELSYASTTIDKTPNTCFAWCGGAPYETMERYDPTASGTDAANWGTYPSILGNGKNADGLAIRGTPGKRNGISHFIAKNGSSLNQSKTLSKDGNPYVIPSDFTVSSGATLAINPGVVIKLYNSNSSLIINGAIHAEGAPLEPIIFTSFHDDDCGIIGGCGDTNATTTAPTPGDWASIKISSSAGTSSFDHVVIRYGGLSDVTGNHLANLRIENASTTFQNSISEKSETYGAYIKNSLGGNILSNIIRDNGNTGLFVRSSSPTIANNQFFGNGQGLHVSAQSAPVVTANTFIQNTHEAIQIINAYPVLTGNTASDNGVNGVNIQGTLTQDYALSTDFPYFLATTWTVPTGMTLTLPEGTIIKFDNSSSLLIQGRLVAAGTPENNVIFTSIKDDTYGGDTNNDGVATSPAASDWMHVILKNTADVSTLNYVIMRYGGLTNVHNPHSGALQIEDASAEIRNATFEKNQTGIRLANSTSTIVTDSLIQENDPFGILLSDSSPSLQNAVFKNNEIGIRGDGSSSVINLGGIIFDGNTTDDMPATLIP